MRPPRPRFRPAVELLESRTNPAGAVTAVVTDGTLFVDGDDADNGVIVAGTGWQSVAVRPTDSSTVINGLAPGEGLFLGDITRGVVVRTGGGNDTVRVENLRQRRYVGIVTGDGDDRIQIVGGDFRGAVEVVTGAGDDTVETTGARLRGKVNLNAGAGADTLARADTRFDRSINYLSLETLVNGPLPAVVPTVPPPAPDTPPTATLGSTAGESTAAATVPFTVTFSEDVTGFELADLGITNGTASGFTAVSGSVYTFGVIPSADGTITVSLPGDVATDATGNGNPAATEFTVKSVRTDDGMTDTVPSSTDPNFVDAGTGDGLKIWDIQTGSGTAVSSGTTAVQVFYTGFLLDGTVFDSARTTGSPASFNPAGLIVGFREGLIGMTPGGIRRFLIPPAIGYGAAGSPPSIPGNSTLIFEVKLVKVGT